MEGIQDKSLSLVLDTNIVLSGLIWQGPSFELMRLASEGRVEFFTSTLMLYELQDVLGRDKWRIRLDAIGKNVLSISSYGNIPILDEIQALRYIRAKRETSQ